MFVVSIILSLFFILVLYRNHFYTAPQALSFKSYRVLIKERDGDDHGDDDDHGLCLKTFSMNMCYISKSYTKIEHTIDKNIVRTGAPVVSTITSVYFFFHSSFTCTIVMYFVAEARFEELDHDQDSRE